MSRGTKRTREPGFEASIRRLEEIVAALEEGDRPLEESLRLFEEGVALTRQCAARLDEAERRIEILGRGADGSPVLQPFDPGPRDDADDADHADDGAAGDDDRSPGSSGGR
jgi:exodeoxyribonuclease VII small subunit